MRYRRGHGNPFEKNGTATAFLALATGASTFRLRWQETEVRDQVSCRVAVRNAKQLLQSLFGPLAVRLVAPEEIGSSSVPGVHFIRVGCHRDPLARLNPLIL